MGDRSYAQFTFYAIPEGWTDGMSTDRIENPSQEDIDNEVVMSIEHTVRATLDGYSMLGYADTGKEDGIVYGKCYFAEEVSIGTMLEMAPQFVELGCTFEGSQDAKYEADADVWFHTPELGTFHSQSDADGDVVLTGQEIDKILETCSIVNNDPADYGYEIVAAFEEATGKALRDRFKQLREQFKDVPQ